MGSVYIQQPDKKRKIKKVVLLIAAMLLITVVVLGTYLYSMLFKPFTVSETSYIYIDENRDYEAIIAQLKSEAGLPNEKLFRILADRMNYPGMVKTGRYALHEGMTMPDLIRTLRSGNQSPSNITFNNIRSMESLAGRLSKQLMIDSTTIVDQLNSREVAESFGFSNETFAAMFIPNSYEVYWDINIKSLLNRMKNEYDRFWNESRKSKAEQLGLSRVEVSTLASIVEEEATYADEYPVVAGLYLNRIKKGMRLEADPTVKFAVGDAGLQRILFKHLEVDSPYNTYKNSGLPPGPIRIPSISVIDATLSPDQHNYLFMCAKEDLSGRHNFAVTHAEHARNARAYHRALNERGIF